MRWMKTVKTMGLGLLILVLSPIVFPIVFFGFTIFVFGEYGMSFLHPQEGHSPSLEGYQPKRYKPLDLGHAKLPRGGSAIERVASQ